MDASIHFVRMQLGQDFLPQANGVILFSCYKTSFQFSSCGGYCTVFGDNFKLLTATYSATPSRFVKLLPARNLLQTSLEGGK